jgi:plasmid stability protein
MGKMLQVRNVPEEIHRVLKSRAASAGKSLSDYVLAELRGFAARPTTEDLLARLAARTPIRSRQSSAALIRQERDSR